MKDRPGRFRTETVTDKPKPRTNIVAEDEESEPWEVQYILDVRKRGKEPTAKFDFLVKWNLLPESQAEWIPEEQLDCPHLVNEFMMKKRTVDANRASKKYEKVMRAGVQPKDHMDWVPDSIPLPRTVTGHKQDSVPAWPDIKEGQILHLYYLPSKGLRYWVSIEKKTPEKIEVLFLPKSSKVEVADGVYQSPVNKVAEFSRKELENFYSWDLVPSTFRKLKPSRPSRRRTG
ncbi:unnamed protein product [Vitrella brassicaformis CCMP3155]|uniref:Chromo domain-containing protein n=1 Tax=Vitrella brassicaformis (strain CCMP3155) TaxID=1169540 RepID=A0A0G4E873_VITBC|nr:unnamed protein product [Vitrella brassicaformis CCMP3155]|eukprot:CEL91738.1 unnamed protein product [Vitrella brassicaformis CCMP3155]